MTRKQFRTLAALASVSVIALVLSRTVAPWLGAVAELAFVAAIVVFSFLAGAAYQAVGDADDRDTELAAGSGRHQAPDDDRSAYLDRQLDELTQAGTELRA